jgi:hypothetical protein
VGFDPVHFGMILVVNLAIGFVTPPVGINLFVASAINGIPVVDIARKAVPFYDRLRARADPDNGIPDHNAVPRALTPARARSWRSKNPIP